jgi:hypothetical protein
VCGRRFGKTFLGKAEMRRAARLAVKWGGDLKSLRDGPHFQLPRGWKAAE